MIPRTIASVERAAFHRNGGGAEGYTTLFFTASGGRKLHALVFAEPGRVAVFDLADPTARLCGGWYEHDLRAAIEDIGLPGGPGDPLAFLRERAGDLLTRVVEQRDAALVEQPYKAKLRGIGRHLERAVRSLDAAIERAKA